MLLVLISGGILTDARVARAKGTADKLTIRGPGLAGVIEVVDSMILEKLGGAHRD